LPRRSMSTRADCRFIRVDLFRYFE
jgi:hypothetical protein